MKFSMEARFGAVKKTILQVSLIKFGEKNYKKNCPVMSIVNCNDHFTKLISLLREAYLAVTQGNLAVLPSIA
jgi:hypothetical protein